MQANNIILGGDLNFSLGFLESWGHMAQVDGLTDDIRNMLEAITGLTSHHQRSGTLGKTNISENTVLPKDWIVSLSRNHFLQNIPTSGNGWA